VFVILDAHVGGSEVVPPHERKTAEKIHLPFIEAFHISIENIRIRFTRSLITLSSVVLGIAFLVFLLTTANVLQVYSELTGTDIPLQSNQYWLVGISLLVCAVSITNSMLIAVYERYKEIGTMKCLGALNSHILMLFLIESALIGLIGGVLGFVLGELIAIISHGMRLGFDVIFSVPMLQVLLNFVLSVFMAITISIIATIYPAYRAANANPAEALRFEI